MSPRRGISEITWSPPFTSFTVPNLDPHLNPPGGIQISSQVGVCRATSSEYELPFWVWFLSGLLAIYQLCVHENRLKPPNIDQCYHFLSACKVEQSLQRLIWNQNKHFFLSDRRSRRIYFIFKPLWADKISHQRRQTKIRDFHTGDASMGTWEHVMTIT